VTRGKLRGSLLHQDTCIKKQKSFCSPWNLILFQLPSLTFYLLSKLTFNLVHYKLYRKYYSFSCIIIEWHNVLCRYLFVTLAIVSLCVTITAIVNIRRIYTIYFHFGASSARDAPYAIHVTYRNKAHGSELIGAQGSNWSSLRDIRWASKRVIATQTSPLVFNLTLRIRATGASAN